jgi:surface antigen
LGTALLFRVPREAPAAGLGFLARSAEGKFSDDDVRIPRATASTLLTDGVPGQSQDWKNPNTTAHGTLTIVKVFQSTEGFSCKSLRVENFAAGLQNRATYAVCEVHPGHWKLHTQAKPQGNQ